MCYAYGDGSCRPADTTMNYFYPTVTDTEIRWDGKGSELAEPALISAYLAKQQRWGFFERLFTVEQPTSRYLKSSFPLGIPLEG
jgi:hypothetical protein